MQKAIANPAADEELRKRRAMLATKVLEDIDPQRNQTTKITIVQTFPVNSVNNV